MGQIQTAIGQLEQIGIKREDSAMLLPLGMATKVVCRTNLRGLIDMAHQRLCMRAYSEFSALNDLFVAVDGCFQRSTHHVNKFQLRMPVRTCIAAPSRFVLHQ